jgi:tRNA-dihydrouridine synthase A
MMDWTDRHCRFFLRGFSPRVLLYTEMITAQAILRGDRERLLRFDAAEHPVALQLGGSEPADLAVAAAAGEQAGYDEINLNCGCPSDRVASGSFGACLMAEPGLVAECVAAMRARVCVPVTVKLRIGVLQASRPDWREAVARFDEADAAQLARFTDAVVAAGADALVVHARKAVLGAWSPKENREIPPLRYDVVRDVQRRHPNVPVVLNGGLRTAPEAIGELDGCAGVMLGREAYHRPMILAEIARQLWPEDAAPLPDRADLLERMADYAQRELERGDRLPSVTRHMLGLFAGEPGAREYRRAMSEGARAPGADATLIRSLARASRARQGIEPSSGSAVQSRPLRAAR